MALPLESRGFSSAPQEDWHLEGKSINDLISEAEHTGRIYINISAKEILRKVTPTTEHKITTIMVTLEDVLGKAKLDIPQILKGVHTFGLTECPPEAVLLKAIKDVQNPFGQFYQYYLAMNPQVISAGRQVLWTELYGGKITMMSHNATYQIRPDNQFVFRLM